MLVIQTPVMNCDAPNAHLFRVVDHVFDGQGTRPGMCDRCRCGAVVWGEAWDSKNHLEIVVEYPPKIFEALIKFDAWRYRVVSKDKFTIADIYPKPVGDEESYGALYQRHPLLGSRIVAFRWFQQMN